MTGNFHVRFLGGRERVTAHAYPVPCEPRENSIMKKLIAVGLLTVSLFSYLLARQVADQRRADSVLRSLCSEIRDYRHRTGHLPPSLDAIAGGDKSDWLRDLSNAMSITYDPGGAPDRMPRLTVSAGRTFMALQGPGFENSR